MEEIQYLFLAAPLILAGISLMLQHFFDDADRYRVFCAELRAKYLLINAGPLMLIENRKEKPSIILQDFLRFRLVRLHFGIINFIIIFGLGLVISILVSTVILGFEYQQNHPTALIKYFYLIGPSISLLALFCFIVQITFARQNYKTAERITNITQWDLNNKGTFEKQCSAIIADYNVPCNRQPIEIKGIYNVMTNLTIFLYNALHSFFFIIISDAICLTILCPAFWKKLGVVL